MCKFKPADEVSTVLAVGQDGYDLGGRDVVPRQEIDGPVEEGSPREVVDERLEAQHRVSAAHSR